MFTIVAQKLLNSLTNGGNARKPAKGNLRRQKIHFSINGTLMKIRYSFDTVFYLASCFIPLFCLGCGDTQDIEKTTTPIDNTLLEETSQPWQWLRLKDEDWEKLKDEDWVRLTDEEVEEFLTLEIPQHWGFETEDRALYHKYYHATLFQRFGDIPQVRYIVEFQRYPRGGFLKGKLAEQHAAYFEAMYFLFPSAVNRRSFEEGKKVVEEERERHFLDQLRRENPEAWAEHKRAALIRRHGDIPEIDPIADFLRKLELNLPRTDKECSAYLKAYRALYDHMIIASTYEFYAMLEAAHQLGLLIDNGSFRRLEKYREARAAGISLYDIDWDDA